MVGAAVEQGFPLDAIRLLIALYAMPRTVLVEGAFVAEADPRQSVTAGCSCADVTMMLVMLVVDSKLCHRDAPGHFR